MPKEKQITKEIIKKLAKKFGVEEKQIKIALKDLNKKGEKKWKKSKRKLNL